MNKSLISTFVFILFTTAVFAQAPIRKLPSIINHPSLNVFAPYMSFDGNALLFVANNGQDGALNVSYTTKTLADWSEPVDLPKHLITRLNYLRGFSLSADGKKIYITCAKSPVIGGYDIFVSELKGTVWSPMENLMLPINSKSNDGAPTFTPDGNTIYFMRCAKMDQNNAEACSIFKSIKKNGQWQEPEELPASINTGNSQAPRIMADGETLIFSSDKFPANKGGMDLYLTRWENGKWSAPVPLDFVNTERDDQYVSVTALGRYLIKEARGTRNNFELTEFLIPDALRPKGLMRLEGKITDANGGAIASYISATDLQTKKRVYSGRPGADGNYYFYLQEGAEYEFTVNPEQSNITFFAQRLDLKTDRIPQKQKINVVLKAPVRGDEMELNLVSFKPYTSDLDPNSEEELKRLARLIKASPAFQFEVQVLLRGYIENTDQSDPDLTEAREEIQTIILQESTQNDSVETDDPELDSLNNDSIHHEMDSVQTVQEQRIVYYHNDRTIKQAEAIINYLSKEGVNKDKLTYVVNAIPADTEAEKKLTVKVVLR